MLRACCLKTLPSWPEYILCLQRLQESQTIGDASRESKTAWLSTHQSDVLLDLAKRYDHRGVPVL